MNILDALQNPLLFTAISLLLGLIVGSFLNVVAFRLPLMMEREWKTQCAELAGEETSAGNNAPFNLVVPRSRCPHCGHQITALENIPVISYLFLRGRCSECKTRISPRYPIIETITALLSALVAWHYGFGWQAASGIFLTWALISLTLIDLDHQLLPDQITLPFIWLGLLLALGNTFVDVHTAIIGAAVGYLSLWLVFHLFRLATGKEGMGYGDFKLLALFGAWFGWKIIPVVILLSSAVGAVVGIGMILLRGHDRNIPIPFGPYLAAAGWLSMLWGNDMIQAYLGWMGTPALH